MKKYCNIYEYDNSNISKSIGTYICDNINNNFDYNYEEIFLNDIKINYIKIEKNNNEFLIKKQNKLLQEILNKLEDNNNLLIIKKKKLFQKDIIN
jgi:hypothetical protein